MLSDRHLYVHWNIKAADAIYIAYSNRKIWKSQLFAWLSLAIESLKAAEKALRKRLLAFLCRDYTQSRDTLVGAHPRVLAYAAVVILDDVKEVMIASAICFFGV